ncbi:MAG: nicotinate-nucleotide adenylyltransferase [Chloroflexota bacterium]
MSGNGKTMNTGVLGGTFDPIHNGHIRVAEEVKVRLNLTEVLFIPAGHPWLKAGETISAAENRIQMVRLAIKDKPGFKLSTAEIERPGPTYTLDTIAELRSKIKVGDELYFIMGWDSLALLPKWREPLRLIKLCKLVAVPRPGYPLPDLKTLEAEIPGLRDRVTILDKPEIDISATDIRSRVARGLFIGHLVPKPVEEYIKRHKLYLSQ